MTTSATLIYIGDAMCSWCWGFTPVLDRVRDGFLPRIGFRLIVGGLRPGQAAVSLDATRREHLRTHWQAVQDRTGQPFAWEWLERCGFLYDTEPAARAVVTVRRLAPAAEYAYFRAAQEAFYARGADLTRLQTLGGLASALGLDEAEFHRCYAEDATRALTHEDFRTARNLGVQGFPTLLLQQDDRLFPVTRGYLPHERLEPVLRGLLAP